MNQPIFHENLPLIELADYLTLVELYTGLRTAQHLLIRLSKTVNEGQQNIRSEGF
jgi:hypothetical protein